MLSLENCLHIFKITVADMQLKKGKIFYLKEMTNDADLKTRGERLFDPSRGIRYIRICLDCEQCF